MTDKVYELNADEQVAVLTVCVKLLAKKIGMNEEDLFNEAWELGDSCVFMQDIRLNRPVHYYPPFLHHSVHYDQSLKRFQ